MVLQWIRKWFSTVAAGAPSEEGVSRAGRFDLYVNGAAPLPFGRFASLKQAEVLAPAQFQGPALPDCGYLHRGRRSLQLQENCTASGAVPPRN
jgi:hypothetical protein